MNPTFLVRAAGEKADEGTRFLPKFDENGLITAVVQDFADGRVLMVAYMNAEALAKTIESGEGVFYSRSRQELWHKGQTSGNVQKVKEIYADCDQDCLVLKVEQIGGAACHTGRRSCFYRRVTGIETLEDTGETPLFDPAEVYKK